MIKSTFFKKLSYISLAICVGCFIGGMHVSAQEETETAGSSLGKTVLSDEGATRAVYEEGWIQNETGWRYQYKDGSYPMSSWRKINGTWYYFNGSGYWVDNNEKETGTLKGIDVSAWQEKIDWKAVKNDGVEFAFIRIGRTDIGLDKMFSYNIGEAEMVDIPAGVYFYSKAQTTAQATLEAQFVIQNMKGHKISYPVVIDLEDSTQEELTKAELGAIAKAFCDEIRSAGYTPMLYANEYWCKNHIDMSMVENVDKWIARYNYTYSDDIHRDIWQCCNTGRIDGIKGNADINFGYKDYSKIITPRTEPVESYVMSTGKWVKDSIGWWYSYLVGGYPANKWENIDGEWYWFDANGYMTTGWLWKNGHWYYLDPSGACSKGWKYIDGVWYYFHPETREMAANEWVGCYYLKSNGAMTTGWLLIGGDYYYFQPGGQLVTNSWIGDYYLKEDGKMAVSEWADNGKYYVDKNGVYVRKNGWFFMNEKWYFLGTGGLKQTGWILSGGIWYYADPEDNGALVETSWKMIGNAEYYFHKGGSMALGWLLWNGEYYYLETSGAKVTNKWIGNYYLKEDGVMAKSEWVDNDRYYVDENGAWDPYAVK